MPLLWASSECLEVSICVCLGDFYHRGIHSSPSPSRRSSKVSEMQSTLSPFLQRKLFLFQLSLLSEQLKLADLGPRWWLSGEDAGETQVDPWSGRIPHALEQLSHGPQLLSLCSRDQKPQLLSPRASTMRSPHPRVQEKPPQWEFHAQQETEVLACHKVIEKQ